MGVFDQITETSLRIFGSTKKTKETNQPPRKRVLFVSHEATRTGAPKIILNILRHFSENCDIQCETILHNGGHLVSEFGRYSEVNCLNIARKQTDELQRKIRKIIQKEKSNTPILAICNSMESRFIGQELAEHNIPVISLVHELPSSYDAEDYDNVFEQSNKVVFPAHAVQQATQHKLSAELADPNKRILNHPLPASKYTILPQGLLNSEFGKGITRQQAHAQIRKELSLPENSFIVLGCGTLDLRKGIDHYANIAKQVVGQNKSDTPVHFVWVGEGPRWTHSPYHYVQLDLEKSKAKPFVHFIGERTNVEPYFAGADAFLMSSRVDPFPCVIHEAMATSLPVITFADSGGAPEALAGGAGFVVPYGDYDQSANIICMLATQPEIAAGIRSRSFERVHSRYRFSDYGDQLIHLSETVMGQTIRLPESSQQTPQMPMARAA